MISLTVIGNMQLTAASDRSPKLTVLLPLSAAFCGAFMAFGFSIGPAPSKSAITLGSYSGHETLIQNPKQGTEETYRFDGVPLYGKYKEIRKRLDYDYHDVYAKERVLFQDSIIDSMLEENAFSQETQKCSRPHPLIVFTAGAMGAGKSHTIKLLHEKGRFPLHSFTVVDPDRIRSRLPEFKRYIQVDPDRAGEMTRKEAGLMAEVLVQAALYRGHKVLVDGSLRDASWYRDYFRQLRRNHPDMHIAILHVTAPREDVFARASVRSRNHRHCFGMQILFLIMFAFLSFCRGGLT